jgi:molecular chaperone GrpE
MVKKDKEQIEEKDIFEEMESEIEEFENQEGEIDEEKLCNDADCENIKEVEKEIEEKEDEKCLDTLARTVADFENFKKRVQRDKDDMIFFLKQDIFKKILPSVDDLDRIIKATDPENTDT